MFGDFEIQGGQVFIKEESRKKEWKSLLRDKNGRNLTVKNSEKLSNNSSSFH